MGGWKHSWYRDESGKAIDIHPSPTKYGTNWITFYKKTDTKHMIPGSM